MVRINFEGLSGASISDKYIAAAPSSTSRQAPVFIIVIVFCGGELFWYPVHPKDSDG